MRTLIDATSDANTNIFQGSMWRRSRASIRRRADPFGIEAGVDLTPHSDDVGDHQTALLSREVAGCASYGVGDGHWLSLSSLVEEIGIAPGLEPVRRLALQLALFDSARYLVACSTDTYFGGRVAVDLFGSMADSIAA